LSLPASWHGIGLSALNDFLFRAGHLAGEASAALLVAGAVFLLTQGMKWRLSAGALILIGLGTWVGDGTSPWFHGNVLEVFSFPGLYLLVGFLAPEPLTTPLTHEGQWLSGLVLGALFVCLRASGGDPEGIYVLPLALGLATPLLDRIGDRRR
jgi:electron transport complex protein RnfD